jgi:DNA uptake protein ComE-like DNA-binding protein
MLFAPRRGTETRQRVRAKSDELSGTAKEQLDKLEQHAGNLQSRTSGLGQKAADVREGTRLQERKVAGKEEGVLAGLNSASRDELMSINGVGPVTANKIIAGRPFLSAQQVVDRGIMAESTLKEVLRHFRAA